MPTATRTVVFTDLANYTASVSRADRASLRNLIEGHERFVQPIVARHNGRIVKNLGDSFLVLFGAATDALRAGLEIVDTAFEGGDLTFRVSAATGDVEEMDGDCFGDAVNLSARINAKTPAGEVWFAESTRFCMNQAEIPWEPVGRFPFKGIAGEMPVYRGVPRSRCVLPAPVSQAARAGMLSRISRGQALPLLPPNPLLLFEGFPPGSPALREVLDALPVLDPARLWLSTYNIAPAERLNWEAEGCGLVFGTPEALNRSIEEVCRVVNRPTGTNTIILDMASSSEFELVMAGIALPRVPMSGVVSGYSYDLLPDGRWVNRSPRAVLRAEITPSSVSVKVLSNAITIGGRATPVSASVHLDDGMHINTPSGAVIFRALEGGTYAGLLLADTPMRLGVGLGQTAEIGREPRHPGVALPDRSGQDNIRWCTGPRAARARDSGFTLDRALAGRRQAAVTCTPDGKCTLRALHDRLPTWIARANSLVQVQGTITSLLGELIITGTTVVALREPGANS